MATFVHFYDLCGIVIKLETGKENFVIQGEG